MAGSTHHVALFNLSFDPAYSLAHDLCNRRATMCGSGISVVEL